jgi:N-methylhydantoinase B
MKDFPIEILETRLPLHVRRYGFRPDSGGAGKWRGGNGVEREFEIECDEAYVSLWWERSKTPAWGLFGGRDATPPDVVINPGREDERRVLKATRIVSNAAMWWGRAAAAAGRRPAERDPDRTRRCAAGPTRSGPADYGPGGVVTAVTESGEHGRGAVERPATQPGEA